jgi:hypothetical protein
MLLKFRLLATPALAPLSPNELASAAPKIPEAELTITMVYKASVNSSSES